MDLPKNILKAALRVGEKQIGLWCSIPDPLIFEMMAGCGFDWMVIDTEHTPVVPARAAALLQAAAPYPVSVGVRAGWNDAVEIKRLLDCGAQTIVVPYVQNAEEAAAAVRAVRYPPVGMRGVAGMTRATRFGAISGYAARASEEICLIVQIETVEAIGQIEEIARVEGVDCIFVGPSDLAASMGFPGEQSHPEVRKVAADAVRRIRAAGKPPGFLALDQGFLREVEEAGALFLAVELDIAALKRGLTGTREAWR